MRHTSTGRSSIVGSLNFFIHASFVSTTFCSKVGSTYHSSHDNDGSEFRAGNAEEGSRGGVRRPDSCNSSFEIACALRRKQSLTRRLDSNVHRSRILLALAGTFELTCIRLNSRCLSSSGMRGLPSPVALIFARRSAPGTKNGRRPMVRR